MRTNYHCYSSGTRMRRTCTSELLVTTATRSSANSTAAVPVPHGDRDAYGSREGNASAAAIVGRGDRDEVRPDGREARRPGERRRVRIETPLQRGGGRNGADFFVSLTRNA